MLLVVDGDGLTEAVGVTLTLPDTLAVGVMDAEAVRDALVLLLALLLALGDTDGVGDAEADWHTPSVVVITTVSTPSAP